MAVPAAWAQRRFSFDFDAAVYPAILMRLRGTPARIDELLGGKDEERLRRRPEEGKWSPLERVGHLIEVEALWETRLDEYEAGTRTLSAADMGNRATFEADYNSRAVSAVLDGFRAARRGFVARLDALVPELYSASAQHPRLQVPMRLVDGLYFTAEHDDHELAWIWHWLSRTG